MLYVVLDEDKCRLDAPSLCLHRFAAMSAYGDLAASGQIRLLKLDDVQPNLDLSGTLRVVNLSDLPNYYAVSYTWGSPKDSKQILISGIAYTIRKNLWECLHALMHNFEHLRGSWLWADALCIRQDCVEEKNRQVSQIHHVFAGAEHVYAWLGKDPQVEQSLSCFPTSLDELAPTKETYRHAVLIHTEPNFVMRTKVNTEPWEAVAFCSYFTRTWVVQECALAKALTFVCGQITWYVRTRRPPSHCMQGVGPSTPSLYTVGVATWTLEESGATSSSDLGLPYDYVR